MMQWSVVAAAGEQDSLKRDEAAHAAGALVEELTWRATAWA
jgi:hypothetical protein